MDTPEGRAIIYRTAELLPDNPRAILLAAQTAVGQGDYARAEQILPANIKDPQQAFLPAPNLSTSYVFATGNTFFAYPNNYNYYVSYYKDTFQHGGISMEEMIIPVVMMKGRK